MEECLRAYRCKGRGERYGREACALGERVGFKGGDSFGNLNSRQARTSLEGLDADFPDGFRQDDGSEVCASVECVGAD